MASGSKNTLDGGITRAGIRKAEFSHNFIVFAEMMQMEQKIVDFFSIKVYLRIKIWIQNQISKIINQKCKSKTSSKEIGIFICWVWEAGKGKRIYDKSKT